MKKIIAFTLFIAIPILQAKHTSEQTTTTSEASERTVQLFLYGHYSFSKEIGHVHYGYIMASQPNTQLGQAINIQINQNEHKTTQALKEHLIKAVGLNKIDYEPHLDNMPLLFYTENHCYTKLTDEVYPKRYNGEALCLGIPDPIEWNNNSRESHNIIVEDPNKMPDFKWAINKNYKPKATSNEQTILPINPSPKNTSQPTTKLSRNHLFIIVTIVALTSILAIVTYKGGKQSKKKKKYNHPKKN